MNKEIKFTVHTMAINYVHAMLAIAKTLNPMSKILIARKCLRGSSRKSASKLKRTPNPFWLKWPCTALIHIITSLTALAVHKKLIGSKFCAMSVQCAIVCKLICYKLFLLATLNSRTMKA